MNDPQIDCVRRCLAGDSAASRELHALYAPMVMAYLLRSGFDRPTAEDLLQETFLRVFRSLASYDTARGTLRPWIATIARNVARKRWQGKHIEQDFDPQLAEEVFAADDNPGQDAGKREEATALDGCVGGLADDLRRIVHMRYVESRTTRGIADELAIPEATVRLRLKDALRHIERCMKGKGFSNEE